MIAKSRIFLSSNSLTKVVWSRRGLCTMGIFLVVITATAWAQTANIEGVRIDQPAASPFLTGVAMSVPTHIPPLDSKTRPISCKMICSPFEPRQSLAEIRWPEKTEVAAAFDTRKLRLDIIGASSKFADGNFGTIRIDAVPRVEIQPGAGIDLEAVRAQAKPVYVQQVKDRLVIPRDSALPSPEKLKKQHLPQALERLPQTTKKAIKADLKAGGFGRMQALAQSAEVIRSVPHRNLVLEGMQPGLTYKIRLVHEGATADNVAENICRVPVCPADFVNPR